jgi:hypothetical protein
MKFSFYNVNELPIAVIDDFYDQKSYNKIWQELVFLNNEDEKLLPPEKTWSATKKENGQVTYLKRNKSIGLDSIYKDRAISSILTKNRKIFNKEITDTLEKHNIFFRYINDSVVDLTLVNYYENENYYLAHKDQAVVTIVTFFYKEPRSFYGGDMIFEDKLKIECLNNRSIFCPSILFHAVETVKMKQNAIEENLGRFSITQLCGIY